MKKYYHLILFSLIILISFLLYSSVFYPLLNSDDGITILMLHNFHLPEDLFFWGQDRVGSVIPLLGQIPFKLLNINHLWAESLTHYLILICGFAAFSTFFKSKTTKVIFAVIWFLPIGPFLGLTRYSFGIQYSFIAIGIYLINNTIKQKDNSKIKKYIIWFLAFISFLFAVWSTESAIVTVAIILFCLLIYQIRNKQKVRTDAIMYSLGFMISGLVIMHFLKNAVSVAPYYEYNQQLLNTPIQFMEAITILVSKIASGFSFNNQNPFITAYCYLCLLQILLIPVMVLCGKTKRVTNWQWLLIFILDGLAFLFINTASHWSLLNGVARRYFVGIYIMLWAAYLIYTEHIINKNHRIALYTLALITVILGAISIPYDYKYIYPKRLTPKAIVVGEFSQLGEIGIISEYWNSHGTSFVDPDNIKAVPHDKCLIRNESLVDSVFSQPRIFIIRDLWLDSFPTNISQYDRRLDKIGDEFRMGDCNVCEYQIHKMDTALYYTDLTIHKECMINEEENTISVFKTNERSIYKHIISGPYLTLEEGEYTVNFYLKTGAGEKGKAVGVMDVVSEYGQNIHGTGKILQGVNSISEMEDKMQLSITIAEKTENVEFRIYYYGQADLTFSKITITQH